MKKYGYLDLHVAGEPFRVLIEGVPDIPGSTMAEKRLYAMQNLDLLRKQVILEPRGHDDMYGGILVPPVNAGSDFGVIFMHGTGMSTMCGHGTIASVRAAAELKLIQIREGKNTVVVDTPSGSVSADIWVKDNQIVSIDFCNALSFAYEIGGRIRTSSYGEVEVDIGYGGAFMVFADIHQFGIEISTEHIEEMTDIAMECGLNAIGQLEMVHPEHPEWNARDNGICMILTQMESEDDQKIETKSFTVFGKRQFDRSPTGTGTSALAAILHEKGLLTGEKKLINRGISNVPFVVDITEMEGSVVPTIHSNAYITGQGYMILEENDPLQEGFTINTGNQQGI